MNKKAQVTIFVIIAILIVGSVGLIVYLRARPVKLPAKLQPVEDYFLSCVSDLVNEGTTILGEQAGYIELPALEQASDYAPFSSQLNFVGSEIPYWFYVSGNGLYKEQIPSIADMQKQLANYIANNLDRCNFNVFIDEGYVISRDGVAKASTKILDERIDITLKYPITIDFADTKKRVSTHKIKVDNGIGNLYKTAKEIFDSEQDNLFFENYSMDVLTLYAPTTGFEIGCVPKTWSKQSVINNIKTALQENIQSIKFKGNYYTLNKEENKYFVYDLGKSIEKQINVLYLKEWPTSFEVEPSDGNIMKADPIGLQEGINVMGFCYVPYHFVYDLAYPVLIQIFDKDYNLFRFPVVVVIDKNKARKAIIPESVEIKRELCEHKVQDVAVNTYDNEGFVDTFIQFKCLDTVCDIGQTEEGEITTAFPQCVNGFIIASAEGYAQEKQQLSTNKATAIGIAMRPFYNLGVEVNSDAKSKVLLTLRSDEYQTTLVYPEQKQINLVSGNYQVNAYVIQEGEFKIESQEIEKCVKVPAAGIAGMVGMKREECSAYTIPAIDLTEVPSGGATLEFYVSEEDLSKSSKIKFYVNNYDLPETQEELQDIYDSIENAAVTEPVLM